MLTTLVKERRNGENREWDDGTEDTCRTAYRVRSSRNSKLEVPDLPPTIAPVFFFFFLPEPLELLLELPVGLGEPVEVRVLVLREVLPGEVVPVLVVVISLGNSSGSPDKNWSAERRRLIQPQTYVRC